MSITIGQKLKQAREDQRLTLDNIFEHTRIRIQYLKALEADDHSVMPSPVQARGYLRNYAEYLGLNIDEVLNDLRDSNAQKPSDQVIGPADSSGLPPAPELEPETPVVESTLQELSPLTKPKPARRKKTESQTEGDSVITPKRRGRKKIEPEPVIEAEPVPLVDIEPQPEVIEESVAEPLPQDSEPVVVSDVAIVDVLPLVETQPAPASSENLWQSWLNRLGTVLAARNKRPTLVQNEAVISETRSEPAVVTEPSLEWAEKKICIQKAQHRSSRRSVRNYTNGVNC